MSGSARLAVALDVKDREAALVAAMALRGHVDIVKVGLELFVGAGPGLIEELVGEGWSVFLESLAK